MPSDFKVETGTYHPTVHHVIHAPELERILLAVFQRLEHFMTNDFSKLQADLDTLKGLINDKVIPILTAVATGDQATIDAMDAEASGLVNALTPLVTPPAGGASGASGATGP